MTANYLKIEQLNWEDIRLDLEREKARIYEEIGTYPTPIAGCDQQFNHLLEQQRSILGELERLAQAKATATSDVNSEQAVADFVDASPFRTLLT